MNSAPLSSWEAEESTEQILSLFFSSIRSLTLSLDLRQEYKILLHSTPDHMLFLCTPIPLPQQRQDNSIQFLHLACLLQWHTFHFWIKSEPCEIELSCLSRGYWQWQNSIWILCHVRSQGRPRVWAHFSMASLTTNGTLMRPVSGLWALLPLGFLLWFLSWVTHIFVFSKSLVSFDLSLILPVS